MIGAGTIYRFSIYWNTALPWEEYCFGNSVLKFLNVNEWGRFSLLVLQSKLSTLHLPFLNTVTLCCFPSYVTVTTKKVIFTIKTLNWIKQNGKGLNYYAIIKKKTKSVKCFTKHFQSSSLNFRLTTFWSIPFGSSTFFLLSILAKYCIHCEILVLACISCQKRIWIQYVAAKLESLTLTHFLS